MLVLNSISTIRTRANLDCSSYLPGNFYPSTRKAWNRGSFFVVCGLFGNQEKTGHPGTAEVQGFSGRWPHTRLVQKFHKITHWTVCQPGASHINVIAEDASQK